MVSGVGVEPPRTHPGVPRRVEVQGDIPVTEKLGVRGEHRRHHQEGFPCPDRLVQVRDGVHPGLGPLQHLKLVPHTEQRRDCSGVHAHSSVRRSRLGRDHLSESVGSHGPRGQIRQIAGTEENSDVTQHFRGEGIRNGQSTREEQPLVVVEPEPHPCKHPIELVRAHSDARCHHHIGGGREREISLPVSHLCGAVVYKGVAPTVDKALYLPHGHPRIGGEPIPLVAEVLGGDIGRGVGHRDPPRGLVEKEGCRAVESRRVPLLESDEPVGHLKDRGPPGEPPKSHPHGESCTRETTAVARRSGGGRVAAPAEAPFVEGQPLVVESHHARHGCGEPLVAHRHRVSPGGETCHRDRQGHLARIRVDGADRERGAVILHCHIGHTGRGGVSPPFHERAEGRVQCRERQDPVPVELRAHVFVGDRLWSADAEPVYGHRVRDGCTRSRDPGSHAKERGGWANGGTRAKTRSPDGASIEPEEGFQGVGPRVRTRGQRESLSLNARSEVGRRVCESPIHHRDIP